MVENRTNCVWTIFVVFVNVVLNASIYGRIAKIVTISTENIYKATKSGGASHNRTLDDLMQEIGMVLHKDLSSRVCSPCVNKIRRFSELHKYVTCSINSSAHNDENDENENTQPDRYKRMSNSPHSSRNNKMGQMAMNVPSPSRKAPVTAPFATKIRAKLGRSLHFGENINDEQLI